MKSITLIKCDDGTIWVTSDEDLIGTESKFNKIIDEGEQMLIALAEFLEYEPVNLLNLDWGKYNVGRYAKVKE